MSRLPSTLSISDVIEKKRILLLVTHATRRDLRARVLRKLGVEVDCAADVSEARSLWRADSYNLVLVDLRNDPQNLDTFCSEIKAAKPPQRVAFFVGKPEYLAPSQGSGVEAELTAGADHEVPWVDVVSELFTAACEALPRRYGFQEASWRIAAARSLKDPRPGHRPTNGSRLPWSWADAVKRHQEPGPLALQSTELPIAALTKEEIS
jgi:CheY-like chemotaxis protein